MIGLYLIFPETFRQMNLTTSCGALRMSREIALAERSTVNQSSRNVVWKGMFSVETNFGVGHPH